MNLAHSVSLVVQLANHVLSNQASVKYFCHKQRF